MIAPEDGGAKIGSREIERRLVGSMRNCIKLSSKLVPRSKTLKKGMFLKIFEIVKKKCGWVGGVKLNADYRIRKLLTRPAQKKRRK